MATESHDLQVRSHWKNWNDVGESSSSQLSILVGKEELIRQKLSGTIAQLIMQQHMNSTHCGLLSLLLESAGVLTLTLPRHAGVKLKARNKIRQVQFSESKKDCFC
jgi:hypothetical protein